MYSQFYQRRKGLSNGARLMNKNNPTTKPEAVPYADPAFSDPRACTVEESRTLDR